MSDMWGRQEQVLRGGLSADRLFMTWPALQNFGLGLMIQQVGVRYSQPIRRVFEIGPGGVPIADASGTITSLDPINCDTANPPAACNNRVQATYYMVGRSDGQVSFSRVVGPEPIAVEFYRTYGTPCTSNVLSLGGRVGCVAGGGSSPLTRWLMTGVLLGDYQMSTAASESFIQEGSAGSFCNLFLQITP